MCAVTLFDMYLFIRKYYKILFFWAFYICIIYRLYRNSFSDFNILCFDGWWLTVVAVDFMCAKLNTLSRFIRFCIFSNDILYAIQHIMTPKESVPSNTTTIQNMWIRWNERSRYEKVIALNQCGVFTSTSSNSNSTIYYTRTLAHASHSHWFLWEWTMTNVLHKSSKLQA